MGNLLRGVTRMPTALPYLTPLRCQHLKSLSCWCHEGDWTDLHLSTVRAPRAQASQHEMLDPHALTSAVLHPHARRCDPARQHRYGHAGLVLRCHGRLHVLVQGPTAPHNTTACTPRSSRCCWFKNMRVQE